MTLQQHIPVYVTGMVVYLNGGCNMYHVCGVVR